MLTWDEPQLRRRYEQLIRKSIPNRDVRRISLNTQGALNVVFEVDRRFIFRFPRNERAAKLLEMETRLLPRLARRLSIRIPEPFLTGTVPQTPGWTFMAYERIPGRQLHWARLTSSDRRTLAQDLKRPLRELAEFSTREARRLGVPGGGPQSFRQEMVQLHESIQKYGYQVIPEQLRSQLDAKIRGYLEDPDNFRFRPVLLHNEIHSSHVLWMGGHVAGLIDWGFASVGDPAREFAPWVAHFGTRAIPGVMSGRVGPKDETFLDRVAFYRLMIPIWQIRNRTWAGNLTGANQAVGWLRRALALPPTRGWSR